MNVVLARLSYVPTADQISSTDRIIKIPRPLATKLNLFPTESAHVWSSNDRILVDRGELIAY